MYFIGAVIGAGFASGREIALFFGGKSPVVAMISGLLLGVCCTFFMLLPSGEKSLDLRIFGRVAPIFCVFSRLATAVVFVAMFAGSEYIIFDMFGIKYEGLISAFAVVFLSIFGVQKIKLANAILVPLIILIVAVVFFKNGTMFFCGKASFVAPFSYAFMNMLLGGYVAYGAGKNSTAKEAVYTGLVSGLLLAAMLYMISCAIQKYSIAEMPFFEAAKAVGLGGYGGVLIYLAVFTTFTCAASELFESFNKKVNNKATSAVILVTGGWLATAFIGFDEAVDYGYPFVSALGIVFVFSAFVKMLFERKAKGAFLQNTATHNMGKVFRLFKNVKQNRGK
jgi:uncharacterized membrane protein YkvI